jgi:hypothetical protein
VLDTTIVNKNTTQYVLDTTIRKQKYNAIILI